MSYTINLTNGNLFATIADGTVNTASSMTLVGKNYAGYGQFLDDNFIHLLENSANSTAPAAPLTGQLWWDSTNGLIKVYNGSIFKTVGAATNSATQPSQAVVGDLWYDSVNQQLNVCTVASPVTYIVVGPAYTSSTGTAGAIPETIPDSGNAPKQVTSIYVAGTRQAVYSTNATFNVYSGTTPGFPAIYKGLTMSNVSGTNISGNLVGGGNVVITTAGSNTVATFTGTGANITGYVTASANVTGGNILTAGILSVGGNIYGTNFVGNVIPPAGGSVSTTGNVTGGNILTSGLISATGNINGNFFNGNGYFLTGIITSVANINNGTSNVNIASANANIVVNVNGNANIAAFSTSGLAVTGLMSATGNVAGAYILGNGAGLTGLTAAASSAQIELGTSNIKFAGSGNAATINIGGTSNVVIVDTSTLYANVLAPYSIIKNPTSSNAVGNIGAPGGYFNQTFTDRVNATTVSAAGNITGGNLSVSTGNASVGNLVNNNANGVGNIGSATTYFNRVFAQATTALYADVAERFAADEILEPGTVVELGGRKEITRSVTELSENVFGVISTRAAYLMNGGAGEDDTHPPVAMTGRVPVKVVGTIHKGDRLVSAGNGIARAAKPGEATSFNVIGRSLVDKLTPESGTIEAIVTIKN